MRVLLVAAPGAGKGTQATRIAERYGIRHISSGELLRAHMRDGTPVGQEAQAYVERGDLVPDETVVSVLADTVLAAAAAGGYVLDGFPRTAHQAKMAYDLAAPVGVEVQLALAIDVPHDELLRRLLQRSSVERRTDDAEDTIRHRLEVFDDTGNDLLGYYETRGILRRVDGVGALDEVSERIWAVLDPIRSGRE